MEVKIMMMSDNGDNNPTSGTRDSRRENDKPEVLSSVLKETFDLERLEQIAAEKICQIVQDADDGTCDPKKVAEAEAVLRALPLTQYEYFLASRRIANAVTYFLHEQWGPGRYEISLVQKSLLEPRVYL
jgi:hypothetical protein